ncbi:gluconate 2-dehydrogenase subunit 3 family protein [Roseivirga pacifica]|uniref:gluconate 2-dehydrogenase subunit 3 family protein n=1 Tax=Roseivirga pacifica TaxID=1267423 RepID=UPI003BAC156D
MERREALKNIGFGSAALFTSSMLFGALQGCSSAPTVDWVPTFFTPEEAAQLEKICEGICPPTSTPGAVEAGVPNYLDQSMKVIEKHPEADHFRKGMAVFVENFDKNQPVKFNKATTEQVTTAINEYYKKYDSDPSILKSYRESASDKAGEKSAQFLETHFVTQVVDSTFYAYFTSELVGETVMPYDPIPVQYQGCLPLELGQMSWSNV